MLEAYPSVRYLRIFEAVARLESVTRASADVGLTQPAVTQAIAKLERDHARSSRAQELATLLGQLEAGLGSDGLGEVLPKLLKAGDDVARIDADAEALRDRLNSLAAEAEDIRADFARLGRGLSSDDESAAELDGKMNLWLEFRRKYGPGAEAVREKREALRRRLASQGDVEARVAKLKAEAAKVEKDLRKQADVLRAARTKAADKLAAAAKKMLGSLGFKKADLRIEVAVAELGPRGADAVRFLFCPNAGQDLLPLDQIASSGEAARVMLALKTVLAAVDQTPVLVFDEVDANVGGDVTGYFANPAGPNGDRFAQLGGQGISVVAASEKQDAALTYIKWFAQPDVQAKWWKLGGYSALRAVVEDPGFATSQPYAQTFLDSMAIVKDFWAEPSYATLMQSSQKWFHDYVVAGNGTAKEALDGLVADWHATFEEEGKY